MMFKGALCCLDIGSSKIAAVGARVEKGKIVELACHYEPSLGVKKGSLVDSAEMVGSVQKAINGIKDSSGMKIKKVYATISGPELTKKRLCAVVPLVDKGNKVVSKSDVNRVNEQARILGADMEEETLYAEPLKYAIDSKDGIKNPLGLYGHTLEVEMFQISFKLAALQSLSRAFNQAGFELGRVYYSGWATSKALLDSEHAQGICVVCDIGFDVTEITVFKDARIIGCEYADVGGDYITEQIALSFKIPKELAEEIKKTYAVIGEAGERDQEKEILVKKANSYEPLKQRQLCHIVTRDSLLLCNCIKESIEKIIPCYQVSQVIASGRTVLTEGFLEALENTLGTPVKLGRIRCAGITSHLSSCCELSGLRYLPFVTSLGLLCELLYGARSENVYPPGTTPSNLFLKLGSRVKEIYQDYF